mmetsp:Transcript_9978/g.25816  ORF Transcript_9978/g.25816 Transcript_9978/m.25816 type:complete len:296 (+) Transcript_9978:2627-3514(+)
MSRRSSTSARPPRPTWTRPYSRKPRPTASAPRFSASSTASRRASRPSRPRLPPSTTQRPRRCSPPSATPPRWRSPPAARSRPRPPTRGTRPSWPTRASRQVAFAAPRPVPTSTPRRRRSKLATPRPRSRRPRATGAWPRRSRWCRRLKSSALGCSRRSVSWTPRVRSMLTRSTRQRIASKRSRSNSLLCLASLMSRTRLPRRAWASTRRTRCSTRSTRKASRPRSSTRPRLSRWPSEAQFTRAHASRRWRISTKGRKSYSRRWLWPRSRASRPCRTSSVRLKRPRPASLWRAIGA